MDDTWSLLSPLSSGREPYHIIETFDAIKRYRRICPIPGRSWVSSTSENHVDQHDFLNVAAKQERVIVVLAKNWIRIFSFSTQ